MHLFIDTVSHPAAYLLFDSERRVVSHESLELKGSESERFLESLLSFLGKNSIAFQDLRGVVAVNGPGSFTAMRIVTLCLNTLSFVHHTPLYSVDYFLLGELSGWGFPMMIRANRGEYLVKKTRESPPELVPIPEIPAGDYSGIGDINDFTNVRISIQSELDYARFCRDFRMENPTDRIEPFYIKKPNIT